ncbi:MAG: M3 family metallopeptidase [Nevskia sp.]|nr:M3 family metallopeptidase [Nevskia sp.]
MKRFDLPAIVAGAALASLAWLGAGAAVADETSAKPAADAAAGGPFAQDSALPFNLPPFDKIAETDYRPAFEAGMAQQRKEVDAIAASAEPATFDNTVVALERSGRLLTRVSTVFFNLTSSNTSDTLDQVQAEMAPKLSAHQDAIFLDPKLFARVEAVYAQRAGLGLDAESLRLVERYHTLFVRAGARLSDADKQRLRQYNERIATLNTQFQQTLLKATNDGAVVVDRLADLDGLAAPQIDAAAQAAKARKLDGKWVLTLQNTTGQPALAQLKNRALRERLFKASAGRGAGGPDDTTAIVAELVKLRAQRAALLGYPDHAAYELEDETAGTKAAVNKMLGQLAASSEANARQEAAELQKLIDAQARAGHTRPFELQPWDWAFYAEQLRKQRYDFDEAQVKPYFELNHVLQDGVFYAAHELYGLNFKERTDLPVYQKDVRVFEVQDRDGTPLALFLADYYRRDNKQGGAWMNEYISQSRLLGLKPVVVNNLNVAKPADGQPALLSFDDVNGMFHEFGHALHGMFSDVNYPLFAGTAVPRDYVEYPSQYNEMWSRNPQVLAHFARHYQTGEPMPAALMQRVLAAQKFNEGFATSEYLAAAILDQAWHQITPQQAPAAKDVMAFEAAALKKAHADFHAVPPRYHSTYFAHTFSNGYDAGYYAYIWCDVLAKDTEHWMNTHGGLQRANGDFVRAKVLSKGFAEDPLTAFTQFYGAPPEVGPLLEFRGLARDGGKAVKAPPAVPAKGGS